MEVAARGSGDRLTPGTSGDQGSASRVRLNVVLYVVALLCVAAVGLLGSLMWDKHADDGGDRSGSWLEDTMAVVTDERVDVARDGNQPGEDLGGSTVEKVETAPEEEEQERVADQLEAGSTMVDAFLNLRYDEFDANVAAVADLATGDFLDQWTKATTSKRGDLVTLIKRAQAVQTGEVVWIGLVAGDDDDAKVIAATTGTIANKLTDFEERVQTNRILLDLDLVDGQWLTSDLQFVE